MEKEKRVKETERQKDKEKGYSLERLKDRRIVGKRQRNIHTNSQKEKETEMQT
jgi:hypothetical protein